MGRKPKLTKELIKKAEELLAEGNPQMIVWQSLGISRGTWYKWLQEGERAKSGLKRDFFDAIKRAEAKSAILHLRNINRSAFEERNWTASAWLLERRFPELFGRRNEIDLTGDGSLYLVIEKIDGKVAADAKEKDPGDQEDI